MARVTSETGIANLALSHLKVDAIVNIDPPDANSTPARTANKWYDTARRAALEEHPWNFASKRVMLNSQVSTPIFEYSLKYELPADFIRVNRIGLDWSDPEKDYEIEDGFIICGVTAPLKLVYVYDIIDVNKFNPKFVIALSYLLASYMAYELTGNTTIVKSMFELWRESFTSAASIDGQNRPTRRIERSRLRTARQTGISPTWYNG